MSCRVLFIVDLFSSDLLDALAGRRPSSPALSLVDRRRPTAGRFRFLFKYLIFSPIRERERERDGAR